MQMNSDNRFRRSTSSDSSIDWRKYLKIYDINSISDRYTCDVLLMAEISPAYSHYINLFKNGCLKNSKKMIKTISFDDVIKDIQNGTSFSTIVNDRQLNLIYVLAISEAQSYTRYSKPLSLELISQLIKLYIIGCICKNANKRSFEEKCIHESTHDEDFGVETSSVSHIYFVLVEFYDPDLINELYKVGISLYSIIEFANVNDRHLSSESEEVVKTDINYTYEKTEPWNLSNIFNNENESLYINPIKECRSSGDMFYSYDIPINTRISNTCEINLTHFWTTIYDLLEGESLGGCLQNTVHIQINVPSTGQYYKNSTELFNEIKATIQKVSNMKVLYINYINQMKICTLKPKPEYVRVKAMKTYNKLMNVVPPDCFTVSLLLHCLLEEVSNRSKCYCNKLKKHKLNSNTYKCNSFIKPHISNKKDEYFMSTELQNTIASYKHIYSTVLTDIMDFTKIVFNPKLKLKISRNKFPLDHSNILELRIGNYPQLLSQLQQINYNYLKKYSEIMVFEKHRPIEGLPKFLDTILSKGEDLYKNLTEEEISYIFSARIFNKFYNTASPSTAMQSEEIRTMLQLCFPPRFDINKITVTPSKSLNIENLSEGNTPYQMSDSFSNQDPINMFNSVNIENYHWHEKLDPSTMLQRIQQANMDYYYVNSKYCSYNDSVILRYHNNLDPFGINIQPWGQFIATPVPFRDFCKYLIHEKSALNKKLNEEREYNQIPVEEIIHAYAVQSTIVKLTGRQIVFQSLDSYKITVENTRLIGEPLKILLGISFPNWINFYLNYNEGTYHKAQFYFQFTLPNGTAVVFSKPKICEILKKSIGEKLCKIVEHKPNPRGMVYTQGTIKSIRYQPWVKMQREFIRYGKHRNRPATPCVSETSIFDRASKPETVTADYLETSEGSDKFKFDLKQSVPDGISQKKLCSPSFIKQIKRARKVQSAMFKICSSRLHKLKYIKPAKLRIYLKFGTTITIPLLCRHPTYKITKIIESKRMFPVQYQKNSLNYSTKLGYDVNLSLPSGLCIKSVPGLPGRVCDIKQHYIDKGPQFQNMNEEHSRTYSPYGIVTKYNTDGSIHVYFSNGRRFTHQVQYYKTHRLRRFKITVPTKVNILKPPCISGRKVKRILERRSKHFIGGYESRYYKIEQAYTKRNSFKAHDFKQTRPFCFNLLTEDDIQFDGIDNYYTNPMIAGRIKSPFRTNRTVYEILNDGTTRILNDNGRLITEFPDKTRIISWYEVLPNIISTEEAHYSSFSLSNFNLYEDSYYGFVDVCINYMFEHPNFATVIYTEKSNSTKILLPDKASIIVSGSDSILILNDSILTRMNDTTLTFESRLCQDCRQIATTQINVQQLYYPNSELNYKTELLKTHDSYDRVFCVNYDGNCYRNENLKKNICDKHDAQYQKLFILKRNLFGSRLLDINAYNQLLKMCDDDTSIAFSKLKNDRPVEIRKLICRPYLSPSIVHKYQYDPSYGRFQLVQNEKMVQCITTAYVYHLPCCSNKPLYTILDSPVEIPKKSISISDEVLKSINKDADSILTRKLTVEKLNNAWSSLVSRHNLFYSWLPDKCTFHPEQLGKFEEVLKEHNSEKLNTRPGHAIQKSVSEKCDCDLKCLLNMSISRNDKLNCGEVLHKIKLLESPSLWSQSDQNSMFLSSIDSSSDRSTFKYSITYSDYSISGYINYVQEKIMELALRSTVDQKHRDTVTDAIKIAVANDIIQEILERNLSITGINQIVCRLKAIDVENVIFLHELPFKVLHDYSVPVIIDSNQDQLPHQKILVSRKPKPKQYIASTNSLPVGIEVAPIAIPKYAIDANLSEAYIREFMPICGKSKTKKRCKTNNK